MHFVNMLVFSCPAREDLGALLTRVLVRLHFMHIQLVFLFRVPRREPGHVIAHVTHIRVFGVLLLHVILSIINRREIGRTTVARINVTMWHSIMRVKSLLRNETLAASVTNEIQKVTFGVSDQTGAVCERLGAIKATPQGWVQFERQNTHLRGQIYSFVMELLQMHRNRLECIEVIVTEFTLHVSYVDIEKLFS